LRQIKQAGRFIFGVECYLPKELSGSIDAALEYKTQQSTETQFRFLKDPLFLLQVSSSSSAVERSLALAMVMGLLPRLQSGKKTSSLGTDKKRENQLGKTDSTPTLR